MSSGVRQQEARMTAVMSTGEDGSPSGRGGGGFSPGEENLKAHSARIGHSADF